MSFQCDTCTVLAILITTVCGKIFRDCAVLCCCCCLSLFSSVYLFIFFCDRIHGIAVANDKTHFHRHADAIYKEIGVDVKSHDILDIVEGYKGRGYGIACDEDYSKHALYTCTIMHHVNCTL